MDEAKLRIVEESFFDSVVGIGDSAAALDASGGRLGADGLRDFDLARGAAPQRGALQAITSSGYRWFL